MRRSLFPLMAELGLKKATVSDIQQDMGSEHGSLLRPSNASVQRCDARLIMAISAVAL